MVYGVVARNESGIFNKGKPVILCFNTEAEMGKFVKEVINRKYINVKAPATEEDLRKAEAELLEPRKGNYGL